MTNLTPGEARPMNPDGRPRGIGLLGAILGVLAGGALAFGGLVLLFELGESGTNTQPWQALVGWVLPVVLLAVVMLRARSAPNPMRVRRQLGAALIVGLALGIGALVMSS